MWSLETTPTLKPSHSWVGQKSPPQHSGWDWPSVTLPKLKNLCVFVRTKQLYDGFDLNYGGSGDSSLRTLKELWHFWKPQFRYAAEFSYDSLGCKGQKSPQHKDTETFQGNQGGTADKPQDGLEPGSKTQQSLTPTYQNLLPSLLQALSLLVTSCMSESRSIPSRPFVPAFSILGAESVHL